MTDTRIAKLMWDAYAIQAGWDSFDGKPLPAWDELSEDRQSCWVAAASVTADRIEKLEAQLAQSQLKRWAARREEQSDRIEKLEAALRDIVDERGICGHCGQLATGEGKRSFVICDKAVLGLKGPCHWTPQDPKNVAHKALEGKDD